MENEVISSFFCGNASDCINKNKSDEKLSDQFLDLIDDLNNKLEALQLPPAIKCIYNPTIYARHTFEMYVQKYCNNIKPIMFFGMNPGPFGMSQTGVPFGEVSSVRDWLRIEGPVGRPPVELEARPVRGFECTRTEISGKRFWGLLKEICGTPERFFETSFVYNYLNQQWMKSNGCNLTPGDFKEWLASKQMVHLMLSDPVAHGHTQHPKSCVCVANPGNWVKQKSEMKGLYDICDPTFVEVLLLYQVQTIVAVGKFCEDRAKRAIEEYLPHKSKTIKVLYLPHPSPRTVNNNDWDQKAIEYLKKYDLLKYYRDE